MRDDDRMYDGTVRPLWSDDELDRALGALHTGVRTDEGRLGAERVALLAAAERTGRETAAPDGGAVARHGIRRPRRRWPAAAAAAAVLVAGGLVAQNVAVDGNPLAVSAAAAGLRASADRIHAADPALRPGQYRYVDAHVWWQSGTQAGKQRFAFLAENRLEMWIPPDESQVWLWHRDVTGRRQWQVGTEQAARAAGVDVDGGWPEGDFRAKCGDFFLDRGERPCSRTGNWQDPKDGWIAGLPRDPEALYDRLRADAPHNSLGDAELLVYAADALRTGRLPADLRAALYRAIAMIPGIEITDQVANLDGRTGVAYGMAAGATRQDIIIDPETGEFIGEREVLTKADGELEAGTVLTYTAVSTGVSDRIGARPAR